MLIEQHCQKQGKISDKWSSYFSHYERLFQDLRLEPIRLLEIGVQNGGSLETWAGYFQSAIEIIGCDINEQCSSLSFDDSRIKMIEGDANSPAVHQEIGAYGTFDIIIDDGSHVSRDVLLNFLNYFSILKPGGLYVVEDTHCLYVESFGGGITNALSAMAFFQRLTDLVNYEFWSDDSKLESVFSTFMTASQVPNFLKEGWVDSVEFRNSIITIRKAASPGHHKIGSRLVCGLEGLVDPRAKMSDGSIHPFKART